MHAQIAGVSQNTGSFLKTLFTQVKTTFSHLKKSEVAEALIATWCIEFLRVRKLGGFHVVEIVLISVLMLGVKTIVTEAGRRKHNVKTRSYPMSSKATYMEPVAVKRNRVGASNRSRRPRFDRRHTDS